MPILSRIGMRDPRVLKQTLVKLSKGNELNCQELVELVTDYLEGALSPDEQARFEAHVAGCDGCARYLEQVRLTVAVVGRLTEETIVPAARAELLQFFCKWKAGG